MPNVHKRRTAAAVLATLCYICEAVKVERRGARCPECKAWPKHKDVPQPFKRNRGNIGVLNWRAEKGSTWSWWVGIDRDEFAVRAAAEQPRMSRQHLPPQRRQSTPEETA